jgi:hypothetical protein
MSGLEVACGDEFATGSNGELRIRGAVRNAAWPYSTAGPAAGNALHVDPNQGAWVVRRDPIVVDFLKTLSGGGQSVTSGKVYTYAQQDVKVTNPSSVQRAAVLFTWFYAWNVDIAANAIADVQGSIIRLNNRTTANWQHLATNHNQAKGVTNPTWTWYGSRTDVDTEYLEVGQSSTYRIQLRVLCGANGSLKANNATMGIRGLGVLL